MAFLDFLNSHSQHLLQYVIKVLHSSNRFSPGLGSPSPSGILSGFGTLTSGKILSYKPTFSKSRTFSVASFTKHENSFCMCHLHPRGSSGKYSGRCVGPHGRVGSPWIRSLIVLIPNTMVTNLCSKRTSTCMRRGIMKHNGHLKTSGLGKQ